MDKIKDIAVCLFAGVNRGQNAFAPAHTVDLSENIAGKNALQRSGRDVGIKILEHFAKTIEPKPDKKGDAER